MDLDRLDSVIDPHRAASSTENDAQKVRFETKKIRLCGRVSKEGESTKSRGSPFQFKVQILESPRNDKTGKTLVRVRGFQMDTLQNSPPLDLKIARDKDGKLSSTELCRALKWTEHSDSNGSNSGDGKIRLIPAV